MAETTQAAGIERKAAPPAKASAAGPAQRAVVMATALRQRLMGMPQGRRNGLLAAVCLVAAVCTAMTWYAQRPDWRVLFSGLDGKDVQQVSQELTVASIPYRLSADGAGVEVPAEMVDKARMEVAAKGMPQTGRLGFELFDKPNWVGSEFDERVNYQRALEGELEHTIGTLGAVRSARVHLVLPQPSLFTASAKVREPLQTGLRVLDGMLTVGRGQRIGIFGGSGVGKSTLIGMMTRNTAADITVVGLIGERGREVREFVEDALGEEGRQRSVVLVSTSDESPLLRIRAAMAATSVAEFYAAQGKHVLLVLDSLTRYAMAAREVGLAAGEPPASKGYTPSVFTRLAKLVERAGNFSHGSVTAFYTVLMEGDDQQDPVVDAVRSLLDGHVVLSRSMASAGWYPPVDVLDSLSRLMPAVTTPMHSSVEETPEAYNFSRAGQVTHEQMRAIGTVNDLFARNLMHTLGAWLRTHFQAKLASAKQISYTEFLGRLKDPTYVCSVRLELLGTLGLLELDLLLASPIVDLLLGGIGHADIVRELTHIEEAILGSVVEKIVRELNVAWRPVGLGFTFEKRETAAQVARMMPSSEKTMCVTFEIDMPQAQGTMSLCLPTAVLNSILRQLVADRERPRRRSEESGLRLRKLLGEASFGAVLQFPPMRLRAREIAEMASGTVLRLPLPCHAAAELRVGGIALGRARPVCAGEHRGAQMQPDRGNDPDVL